MGGGCVLLQCGGGRGGEDGASGGEDVRGGDRDLGRCGGARLAGLSCVTVHDE